MRIRIIASIVGLFLLLPIICSASDYDFRKTTWGMSQAEVLTTEEEKPDRQNDMMLGYRTTLLKKSVLVGYFFIENKLIRTKYLLLVRHSNENAYLIDFQEFKIVLTKKYGNPRKDEIIWLDSLYKTNLDRWGFAVSIGDLQYFVEWETETTIIFLFLTGDNYEISCGIEYYTKDPNLVELEKKKEEQQTMEQF